MSRLSWIRFSLVTTARGLAAAAAGAPARAAATPEDALKAYGSGYAGYPLSHPRLTSEGRLVLQADPQFMEEPLERPRWIQSACANWTGVIRSTGAAADPSLLILLPDGGALYECGDSHPTAIENWSDAKTVFSGVADSIGNFYVSFAGQANFGPTNSYGFNMAEGVTMYHRHFDIAATVGLVSANITMSIGALVRYRLPITSFFGVNAGINPGFQMSIIEPPSGSTADPAIVTSFVCGFLGGFNFYVPTGTIDLTGSYSTNGSYAALVGHTFFFNVR
jgi:hypothetical protein